MEKSIFQRLLTELASVDFVLWYIAFLLILAALGRTLVLGKGAYQARGKAIVLLAGNDGVPKNSR
jgi:hypothetical protein